jgi:hypothetical protein
MKSWAHSVDMQPVERRVVCAAIGARGTQTTLGGLAWASTDVGSALKGGWFVGRALGLFAVADRSQDLVDQVRGHALTFEKLAELLGLPTLLIA